MAFSLKVHHYEKIPGSQQSRLVRVTPYVRITRDSHPPLYVQGGGVYGEGGQRVETLPAWFDEEMARLSPQMREQVGWRSVAQTFTASNEATTSFTVATSEPAPAKPVKSWTCPAEGCGQEMPTTKKGMHIARHRKAERDKGA